MASRTEADARYAAINATPVGSCMMWPGQNAPSGWVEADGRTTSGMPSQIVTLYGANLPDMRGEFIRGWDNGKGTDSGRSILSTQTEEIGRHTHPASFSGNTMPPHSHNYNANVTDRGSGSRDTLTQGTTATTAVSAGTPTGTVTVSQNGSAGDENRPRNIAWMFIIYTG